MARRLPQMLPLPSRGNTNIDSMRDEVSAAIENNFKAGLKTEFTGLNFPKDAVTSTTNCVYSLVGDVTRRKGFDYEANFTTTNINRTGKAINTYRWTNVGGDGQTQFIVAQVGKTLSFYNASTATTASPLSAQLQSFSADISQFLATGSAADPSVTECQFADGNGYLFVYHKDLDPFYCQISGGVLTTAKIPIQIRDFIGIPEPSVPVSQRPTVLTNQHKYNLENQGWTSAASWTATSTSVISISSVPSTIAFTVASGISGINNGDPVTIALSYTNIVGSGFASGTATGAGTVISYAGTTLTLSITSLSVLPIGPGTAAETWTFSLSAISNLIGSWQSAMGNYPSNADVWWTFRNSSNVFSPGTTAANIPLSTAPAAQGHFLLDAFNQDRSAVSGVSGLSVVTTPLRPKTGAWFSGRVWFAGVDSSQTVGSGSIYYTWSETIYFSQVVTDYTQFGMCYQTDDPTDSRLFDLLDTDGGTIVIQGAGSIYKLFPIQNGMLVFASNGIWFITGSQGIGFAANDYTITKISSVRTLSSTTFVDFNGMPMLWNEEGIYAVAPSPQGLGLVVNPLTVGTILTFYNSIPTDSKRYARGSYNPLTYIVQWLYRSTQESSATDRYEYDSILCFNTFTQAFYTYSIAGTPKIHGVRYVANPGGSTGPAPTFKYLTSATDGLGSFNFTFSEERSTSYIDWFSYDSIGLTYTSSFTTGYSLYGQGIRLFQPMYVYMYSRNTVPTAYKIQGVWNFANSGNSGKYSAVQNVVINQSNYDMTYRRHKIRGHGVALQLKISSSGNNPFDIMGWSTWASQNPSA